MQLRQPNFSLQIENERSRSDVDTRLHCRERTAECYLRCDAARAMRGMMMRGPHERSHALFN
eukprot:SAG31_NODE_4215_length_3457_cov_1.360036_5_plen_61_part_01